MSMWLGCLYSAAAAFVLHMNFCSLLAAPSRLLLTANPLYSLFAAFAAFGAVAAFAASAAAWRLLSLGLPTAFVQRRCSSFL